MKYYVEAFSKEYVDDTKLIFRFNSNNGNYERYSWKIEKWVEDSDIGRRYWDGSIDYVEVTESKAKEIIRGFKI